MPDMAMAFLGSFILLAGTTIGSLCVFFIPGKEFSPRLNQIFLGFASGVMLAAAFFSLLLPAMNAEGHPLPGIAMAIIGLALGFGFLFLIDKLTPHLHVSQNTEEGIFPERSPKTMKMFLAVTIHNIPEGLSVGIAYGMAIASGVQGGIMAATTLAIGIALQNIPEGAAVSLPMKSETTKPKAFLFGVASGAVEPLFAIAGIFLSFLLSPIMPYALAFAAGAMFYVIAEEMIPDMKGESNSHFGVWSFFVGFVVMMILEVYLG